MEQHSISDSSWIGPVAQLGPYHVQHKPDEGQTLVLYCEVEDEHRSVARMKPSTIFFTDANYTERRHVDMFVHASYPRGQLLPSAACTLYDADGDEWEHIVSEQRNNETEWVHTQTLGPFALDERPQPGQVVQFSCHYDFTASNNSSQVDEWNEFIHLSPSTIYFAETNYSIASYVRMFVDSSKMDVIQSLPMEISCSICDDAVETILTTSFQRSKLDRIQEPNRWSQLAVAALVLFGSYIWWSSTNRTATSILEGAIKTKGRDVGRRSRKPTTKRKKCSKRSQCHNNKKDSQPQSNHKTKSSNSSSLLLADYLDSSNDSDSETGAEISDSNDGGDESTSSASQSDDTLRNGTAALLHNNYDDTQDRGWEQVGSGSQNINQKAIKSEPTYSFMKFRFKRNKTTATKDVTENTATGTSDLRSSTLHGSTKITQQPADVRPKTYYPASKQNDNTATDAKTVVQKLYSFKFHVEGMVCGGCESVVRNTIQSLDEVDKAEVDVTSGETIVTSTSARLDLTALALSLNDVGMKILMQVDETVEEPSYGTNSANVASITKKATTQNFTRESSLSLLDEIRMDSRKTVKRYRCSCNCNGCICRSHPFNEDDPGQDITLEDLCSRLEATLSASGAFCPLDGLTNEHGGTHELRDQLANLPIPCGCSSSSCGQEA